MTFPISPDSVWITDRGHGEWVVGSGDFELAYVPENVARLFYAAPDLLEALSDIPLDCDHEYPHLLACWKCKASAAIAKATGGSPC